MDSIRLQDIEMLEDLKRIMSRQSPLGPGEARLLRAVAHLVEKEEVGCSDRSPLGVPKPTNFTKPSSEALQATQPKPALAEEPARLVIRLRNIPSVDAARALEKSLVDGQKSCVAVENVTNLNRAVFVPEPVTNSLLISGRRESIDSLTELTAQLDAAPNTVTVELCIAELLPRSEVGKTEGGASDTPAMDRAPSMEEDGVAWLSWAKKQGRLQIISQPKIMTFDNQPAIIQVGAMLATKAPEPGADGGTISNQISQRQVEPDATLHAHAYPVPAANDNPIKQTQVGVTVGLTPQISPQGLVSLELEVGRTSVVNQHEVNGPMVKRWNIQTTISSRDGQTMVLGGPMEHAEDGDRQLVVAVTPHVVLQKR
jgi:type II secretory pathway component GspD/PulD (secretin)